MMCNLLGQLQYNSINILILYHVIIITQKITLVLIVIKRLIKIMMNKLIDISVIKIKIKIIIIKDFLSKNNN